MSQTIEIIVKPDGATTVQTKGFAGSSCRDATRQLEKALGLTLSDQATAELYGTTAAVRQNATQK